ncbi:class Ib ribonucleoside-diphosphate reductase assembly flavoprotein NrdI [Lactobacillus crispatus]|uniref:class Ib ribonucleoside-diphosphate reductase assembly flavoprotein NrdI n=1 Tax=Lactobacillus crispatus TaxID=47770 RepID=UPI0001B2995C|nr:class Ib ribonucleoside-diphosphate reductase assembly flavoprotein NrdI [Lactobacillus crispatus]EEU19194.1 nrdI protein [Lactobacillus crispatus 125-2-CHN]
MVAIAFYSITGQTERFIKKTQLSAHQIDDANPKYDMGKSYILIVPSYQDFMMDSVVDFLTYKDNKKNIIGIIGCGNRNFNDLFAQTAKKITATLKVHILYLLEFSGTNQDVKNVRKIVHDLSAGESTKQVQKPKELRGNISFLSDFRD